MRRHLSRTAGRTRSLHRNYDDKHCIRRVAGADLSNRARTDYLHLHLLPPRMRRGCGERLLLPLNPRRQLHALPTIRLPIFLCQLQCRVIVVVVTRLATLTTLLSGLESAASIGYQRHFA